MGTFAALKYINAEQGGFAGAPAVAIIDAKATAITLANRLQPLGVTSTNNNIIMLGEGVSHFGVRARVGTGTISAMPAVNIYRLYGPESAFASTTLANDGTIQFDVVNHWYNYSGLSPTYLENVTAYAFSGAVATAAVTNSKRDGSYYYSDWAIGNNGMVPFVNSGGAESQGAVSSIFIPTYGARAVLVLQTVSANVSTTCDVLVYPFARGNNG